MLPNLETKAAAWSSVPSNCIVIATVPETASSINSKRPELIPRLSSHVLISSINLRKSFFGTRIVTVTTSEPICSFR